MLRNYVVVLEGDVTGQYTSHPIFVMKTAFPKLRLWGIITREFVSRQCFTCVEESGYQEIIGIAHHGNLRLCIARIAPCFYHEV